MISRFLYGFVCSEKKRIDFGKLESNLLNKSGEEYDEIEQNFLNDLKEMSLEIERLAPSVGNIEKEEEAKKKRSEAEK